MAVVIESSSSVAYGSRTNTTVTAPSGIQNDDILVLRHIVGASGAAPSVTWPSGFTEITGLTVIDSTNFRLAHRVAWKRASGESGNYTVTHTAGSSAASMHRISGAKTSSSPINASSANNGTGPTTTALGITTTVDNCLIMYFGQDWGDTANNLVPPSGSTPTFTELQDVTLIYTAYGTLATAGATGNKTQTTNSNTGNPWTAFLVAIEPAVAATVDFSATALSVSVSALSSPALTAIEALSVSALSVAIALASPALSLSVPLTASALSISQTLATPAATSGSSFAADALSITQALASPALTATISLSASELGVEMGVATPSLAAIDELSVEALEIAVTLGSPELSIEDDSMVDFSATPPSVSITLESPALSLIVPMTASPLVVSAALSRPLLGIVGEEPEPGKGNNLSMSGKLKIGL